MSTFYRCSKVSAAAKASFPAGVACLWYYYDDSASSPPVLNHASCDDDDKKQQHYIVNSPLSSSIGPSSKPGVKLLFLGSGSSTGCPKPICPLLFPPADLDTSDPAVDKLDEYKQKMSESCKISRIANIGDPRHNKNYRNNPSLLISHRNNDQQEGDDGDDDTNNNSTLKNVVIDVGKTFREGGLRWLPQHGIDSIDAIVLTHEHADAMLGLDDIRGFQKYKIVRRPPEMKPKKQVIPMPIFLSHKCLVHVGNQFPYLVPDDVKEKLKSSSSPQQQPTTNEKEDKKDEIKVERHVAALQFKEVHFFEPFVAGGLKMTPLPVMHGEDLICNGYSFSIKNDKRTSESQQNQTHVVYLSDLSRMLPETLEYILKSLPPTDILVVDTLLSSNVKHQSHFNLHQALDLIKQIRPRQKAFLVGMNCDDFPAHDEMNDVLAEMMKGEDGLTVELSHDGLAIEL